MMLLLSYLLHGEAGALDEIVLIAVGLLVLGTIIYAVWRSRDLEPVYDDEGQPDSSAQRADSEAS